MNAILESSKSELRIINNRLQRRRELRRKTTMIGLTLILILVFVITFGCLKSFAGDRDNAPRYKYFKSIQIQPGDTLWSISEDYVVEGKNDTASFIDEVCFMNGIEENETLTSGNYIVVPFYSEKITNS